MRKKILNVPYFFVGLLLFFTFSFLYSSDHAFNQDLGRHLTLGRIIWTTHIVPQTNLFSYTFSDFPFSNHHWLFEVIAYLASVSIGIQALLIFKVIILLFSVTLVLLLAGRSHSVFFFSVSFLFLHMLRGRIDLRPEILSFLFTSVTFYILYLFEKSQSKLVYLLPVISLLWVNSHIYYPVGIFLQLIFLGDLLVKKFLQKNKEIAVTKKLKILSVITGFSFLATLINPKFITGALYAFSVFNNYGVTITENQTIATLQGIGFVNPDFLFFYLCTIIITAAFFIGSVRNTITLKNFGLVSLGMILAFQSIRGFPYFVFLCLPVVLQFLDFKKENVWTKTLNIIVCILLFTEAWFYLSGTYAKLTYRNNVPSLTVVEDAKPALDFVMSANFPQPIFNNFDIGSYLIYRMYPGYKVFIDGRPEAYPANFFNDTYLPMQEEYAVFQKKEQEMHFQTIIFSITDQNPRTINFLKSIIHDSEWKIVFLDQFMIVFVKEDEAQKRHLTPTDLAILDVREYRYSDVVSYTNLSTFLFNMQYFDQAKQFNQKALDLVPQNPAANKIMANILLQDKKPNLRIVNEYLSKSQNAVFW